MSRRLYKYPLVFSLLLLLSGCGSTKKPLESDNSFWAHYFVKPLSHMLDFFADIFWGQYGISILLVTIGVRLIILPLTLKQVRSSKKMQELQPELKKMKEKYKDDPKKQQEETMKLFQQNGVNPLAGCFPLIVQMPVLIALYNAIVRNADIRHHHFLWLQLGTPDPYYILPLCAAITTFLQQKVMMKQTPGNAQMQGLLYIYPILIFVMAMNFASALPLYWIYGNIFTIIQSYFIYGRPAKAK